MRCKTCESPFVGSVYNLISIFVLSVSASLSFLFSVIVHVSFSLHFPVSLQCFFCPYKTILHNFQRSSFVLRTRKMVGLLEILVSGNQLSFIFVCLLIT